MSEKPTRRYIVVTSRPLKSKKNRAVVEILDDVEEAVRQAEGLYVKVKTICKSFCGMSCCGSTAEIDRGDKKKSK